MADLRERFRDLDGAPVPDIWRRADARGPQLPMTFPAPPSRRIGAALLALVLIVGAAMLLWRSAMDDGFVPVGVDEGSVVFIAGTGADARVAFLTGDGVLTHLLETRPFIEPEDFAPVEPALSPDGRWIAVGMAFPPDPQGRMIGIVRADGTDFRAARAPQVVGATNFVAVGSPAWSPDGRTLAFDTVGEGLWTGAAFPESDEPSDLELFQVVGVPPSSVQESALSPGEPAWSPDGGSLAVSLDVDASGPVPAQIHIVASEGEPEGTNEGGRQVTDEPAGSWDPAWSPDGSTIAYVTDGALRTVPADSTGEASTLVDAFVEVATPSWSPSGDALVFAARDGGDWDLYTTDLAGGVRQLTDTPDLDETDPSWGPVPAIDDPTASPTPAEPTEGATITARIPAGQFPHQVAVGFGSVWVGAVTEEPGPVVRELLRIDPTTAEVIARIPVADLPGWEAGNAGTAIGQGALWLAGDGALERVDPTTNGTEVIPLDIGHFHADVWVDDEGGWVLSFGEGDASMLVTRFEPATGDVIWTQPVPLRWGLSIVRSGPSVWVWGDGHESGPMAPNTVVRLDATTGTFEEELTSESPPAIALDGQVWAGRDGVLGLLQPGGAFTAVEPTTLGVLGFFSPVPDGSDGVWLLSRPPGTFVLTHVTAAGVVDRVVEAPRDAGGQSSAYDPGTDTFWFAEFKDRATRLTLGSA